LAIKPGAGRLLPDQGNQNAAPVEKADWLQRFAEIAKPQFIANLECADNRSKERQDEKQYDHDQCLQNQKNGEKAFLHLRLSGGEEDRR
jgi:hypothetical protein